MKENQRGLSRGFKLGIAGGLLGFAVSLSAAACGGDESPPPAGFTRNTSDYEWKIRVAVEGDSYHGQDLYSNIRPSLTTAGGVAHLIAKDVYCPKSSNSDYRREAGCTAEFMNDFEKAGPDMSIASNKGIKQASSTPENLR